MKIFDMLHKQEQEIENLKRANSAGFRPAREQVEKGTWWMPRLLEAKKDVISCEKPRLGANDP